MSRKLGYEFIPFPRRWHAAWAGATLFETGLRDRLFELNAGEPIPFEGDWLDSLCKQSAVNGRERPPARKALLEWQARGLLILNGQTVWLCCRHDAQPRRPVPQPTHIDCTSVVRPTHNGSTSNTQLESSTRDDSKDVRETDRKKEETDKTTTEQPGPSGGVVSAPPAWVPKSKTRPDLDGFNWFNQLKGGAAPPMHTCKVDYEWIGGRPAPERHQVAQSIAATQWCADNRRNVTPAHVVKYWASYLEGPRNRQQIATSVNPIDVAYGLMKSAEKAYHEAHRYNEPTEPALAAWEAATNHYNTVSKARAS